jgi:mRNA interferase MazF
VVVVQSDAFNLSQIQTVIVAVITSNTRLAGAPGNLTLTQEQSGLLSESVINVSQVITVDKRYLSERIGSLPLKQLSELDEGLRLVLSL